MKVLRGGENQFTILFDDEGTKLIEDCAAKDGKPAEDFIRWMLVAGLEIFKLTLENKET